MIIRFIRWTGWTLTMTMVIDDSTINIAVVISIITIIAITGVWQICLQPLCMYLNNRIRKMRQVNWTMFCTWNVKLLYAAMWSIEWKKKTGGAHGKWKETFHIWNPRIKIGRKGQGCWQQNLLITTGSQRPHTSHIWYKITTNNTERREKNHNTCF